MRIVAITISLAALVLLGQPAAAAECGDPAGCGGPNRCARCGARDPCQQKVCKLVCDVKTEKKSCFCVVCEDFCPLLPTCGERTCYTACGEKPTCAQCGSAEKCDCEPGPCLRPPKCGHMHTKKILVKKDYEVKVPVYKCVVVYLCPSCCNAQGAAQTPADKTPPPAPISAPPTSAARGATPLTAPALR